MKNIMLNSMVILQKIWRGVWLPLNNRYHRSPRSKCGRLNLEDLKTNDQTIQIYAVFQNFVYYWCREIAAKSRYPWAIAIIFTQYVKQYQLLDYHTASNQGQDCLIGLLTKSPENFIYHISSYHSL